VLSQRPAVSDEEAKAAQRRRYAELRWSPDASPGERAGVSDISFTSWRDRFRGRIRL
jgi:hypothetical protein